MRLDRIATATMAEYFEPDGRLKDIAMLVPVGNSSSNIFYGVARPRSATNARALFGTHHAEPAQPSAATGAF